MQHLLTLYGEDVSCSFCTSLGSFMAATLPVTPIRICREVVAAMLSFRGVARLTTPIFFGRDCVCRGGDRDMARQFHRITQLAGERFAGLVYTKISRVCLSFFGLLIVKVFLRARECIVSLQVITTRNDLRTSYCFLFQCGV